MFVVNIKHKNVSEFVSGKLYHLLPNILFHLKQYNIHFLSLIHVRDLTLT